MNFSPKVKFQTKLFISNIFLTLLACTLLGFSVSKVSSEIYLQSFLNNKKNLMQNISELINGDVHSSFIDIKAFGNPQYKKLLKYLIDLSKREKYITWIYTLNYNINGYFTYAIDPSLTTFDTIWIESRYFGMEVYRNSNNKIIIRWNDVEYDTHFSIIFEDIKSNVKIEQGDIPKLYINDVLVLTIKNDKNLIGYLNDKIISEEIVHVLIDDFHNESIPYIRYTFSKAGEPSSIPGVLWEETDEFKNQALNVIKECSPFSPDKPNPVIYGDFYNMISPIYNSNGNCSGVLIFAFSDRILKIFKSELQQIIFYISTITLIISALISYLLSQSFSKNIKEMLEVVNKISLGDLTWRIRLDTNDEFEDLAKKFNSMVDTLQDNMITSEKLNQDLQIAIRKEEELSASLEKKVIERTAAQEQAYKELKASQNQLIQSEKMAALGQLISGIAHEINTPIGAIKASAGNIKLSLNDLLKSSSYVYKNLDEESIQILTDFIGKVGNSNEVLSTKEERKLRKELALKLESKNIKNFEEVAHFLVDLKIKDLSSDDLSLFSRDQSTEIIKFIYNFGGLKIKSNNIETAVEKTSKIVYALKSYSHRDHRGNKIKANITPGIETVLIIYQNYLKQGIEVIKEFEAVPEIECFFDELNQVWTNIIHNSIQAMKNKGVIKISVKNIITVDSKSAICITFSDSGPGIPDEIKDKIFEPFFTTKNAGEGSGLGLHICKQILDKHNGSIMTKKIESGACIEIILPTV